MKLEEQIQVCTDERNYKTKKNFDYKVKKHDAREFYNMN